MGKKMFTIGIPCIFVGVVSTVVMGIYGLHNVDNSLAQTTAENAFTAAYSDLINSEVDFTKFLNLYDNAKCQHLGEFLFEDTELINNSYVELLNDIPVEYDIIRHPKEKVTKASFLLGGEGRIHIESYVDTDNIIVKSDELYNGYFSIPNNNIKEMYEESLWFNLLGDITATLPENFSLDLYSDYILSDYIISDFLKKSYDDGDLKKLINSVSYKKMDAHRDFFVGDTYISSNEYKVSISKAGMDTLFSLLAEYTKSDFFDKYKAEAYEFLAYISPDERLLGAKFNIEIQFNSMDYEVEIDISFAGTENIYEKVIADISFVGYDGSNYSFRTLITSDDILGDKQATTIILAMSQPYVLRMLEVKLERNILTNETDIIMAVNVPGLKGNLNYNGFAYLPDIEVPNDVYALYELNLWEILKIYSSSNWSFIK